MPTEEIAYQITIRGGEEAARVIAAIEVAMARNNAQTDKANKLLDENAGSNKRAGKENERGAFQVNQLGSAFGLAGQAVGRFNPALGQVAQTAGAATGTIQQLTNAGLGPMGIAVAAASVAVPLLTTAVEHFGNAAERESVRLSRGLNRTIQETIGLLEGAAEQQRLFERLSTGTATTTEATANRITQQSQLSIARSRFGAAVSRVGSVGGLENGMSEAETVRTLREIAAGNTGSGSGRDILSAAIGTRSNDDIVRAAQEALNAYGDIERRQRYVQHATNMEHIAEERNARIETARGDNEAWNAIDAKRRNADRESARGGRTGRGGGRAGAGGAPEGISLLQEELNLTNKLNEAERLAAEEAIANDTRRVAIMQKIADAAVEAETRRASAMEQTRAKEAEILQERLAREQEWRSSMGKNAGGDEKADALTDSLKKGEAQLNKFTDAASGALVAALEGGGDMASGFAQFIDQKMKAIAIDETVQGIGALAVAVGNTIFNPPLAASKYGEAGLHFAAAAAAGGIAAAIPNAPAGGAGGTGPGETRPQKSGSGSGSGDTTVIVNFGGEVVTAATEAELGRRIGRMVDSGRARLGRS